MFLSPRGIPRGRGALSGALLARGRSFSCSRGIPRGQNLQSRAIKPRDHDLPALRATLTAFNEEARLSLLDSPLSVLTEASFEKAYDTVTHPRSIS